MAWSLSYKVFSYLVKLPCFYCNTPPSREKSGPKAKGLGVVLVSGVDRADNQPFYASDNAVPCCRVCNEAKMSRSFAFFSSYHQRIREIALGRKYDDSEHVLKEWQAKHLLLIEELKQIDGPKVDRKGQYALPGITPAPEKATARKVRRKLVELKPEDQQLELPL